MSKKWHDLGLYRPDLNNRSKKKNISEKWQRVEIHLSKYATTK